MHLRKKYYLFNSLRIMKQHQLCFQTTFIPISFIQKNLTRSRPTWNLSYKRSLKIHNKIVCRESGVTKNWGGCIMTILIFSRVWFKFDELFYMNSYPGRSHLNASKTSDEQEHLMRFQQTVCMASSSLSWPCYVNKCDISWNPAVPSIKIKEINIQTCARMECVWNDFIRPCKARYRHGFFWISCIS